MNLKTCYISDATTVNSQLPNGVAEGQFKNGDNCIVLGFLGMMDEIVLVSPYTGLTFKIAYNENNMEVD